VNRLREHEIEMDRGGSRQLLCEHFRCPQDVPSFTVAPGLSQESGFFRLNADVICFGQCSSVAPASSVAEAQRIRSEHITVNGASIQLPFKPAQVVDNFRREKYVCSSNRNKRTLGANPVVRNMYYLGRPLMPVMMRKHLQQVYFRGWEKVSFPEWPVDCNL
jgi:hypothetical protein